MAEPLLEVAHLRTRIATPRGDVFPVDDVSLSLAAGGTLGLVGESGSGKSVTARSLLRLLEDPPAKVVGGSVRLRGRELLTATELEMRRVRGGEIAMVFQEPMSALDPLVRVDAQIAEGIRAHQRVGRAAARAKAVELLASVRIRDPAEVARAYPHQLSGGMRQRVVIAMALACGPSLLVADEPTTALDVTVQSQVLALLASLQRERGMALLLITHDLGVVAETCDEVAVMYAGRIVEGAPTAALFARPAHPYTRALLRAIPRLDEEGRASAPAAIPGSVPPLDQLPQGCRFRDRCERALDVCARVDPPLEEKREGQRAACHNPVPEEEPKP